MHLYEAAPLLLFSGLPLRPLLGNRVNSAASRSYLLCDRGPARSPRTLKMGNSFYLLAKITAPVSNCLPKTSPRLRNARAERGLGERACEVKRCETSKRPQSRVMTSFSPHTELSEGGRPWPRLYERRGPRTLR